MKQGIGTFGSRSQAVGGTALMMAGAKVKTKMAKFAAAMFEAHRETRLRTAPSVSRLTGFGETIRRGSRLAYVPVPLPPGSARPERRGLFEPPTMLIRSAAISMLEIDRDREPKLLKLVAVDDAGNHQPR